jgi:hypothetical protein
MSKKISQLPAAANAIDTDQHEVNKAGVSQRLTNGQIAAFMETAMSQLQLTVAGISLNSDGSAGFAHGQAVISGGGDLTLTSGALNVAGGIGTIGNVLIGIGPKIQLNSDGSAIFTNGVFASAVMNVDGSIAFANNAATINPDGSAVFAGAGEIDFDADATIRTTGNISGELVNANTGFSVAFVPGVTQDVVVLTALPSTFKTLHFTGGILTSVT